MGHKLDRIMYDISVIYIALPVFIFLAGWLRLVAAIPVCAVFLVSVFLMMKNRPEPVAWHLTKAQWRGIIASLILLAIWVFLSGQGGFSFQNSDYQYRNAIFRDLINKSWPVIYANSSLDAVSSSIAGASNLSILTYYIAFWLPGALVGKLFGWYAANTFLYLWSFLGLVLITYFLFRTLRNSSVWSVVILIFFSGMDIIGYILITKGKLPGPIDHIEWWSGMQYSSNTTLLFWVFNQTIAIWLAILLIMNLKNSRSLFFLYAMLLLHGPFPFLGMLPIVLWKAYQGYPLDLKRKNAKMVNVPALFFRWFWKGVVRAITFENICGGISVLLIVYFYLTNNVSGSKFGTNAQTTNYIGLVVLEGGLYLLFLFAEHFKKPLYWICLGSLFLIPLFRVGGSQDFCMRVSIPALFVIMIMIQQSLLGKADPETAAETAAIPAAAETPVRDAEEPEWRAAAPEWDAEARVRVSLIPDAPNRTVLTKGEKKLVHTILIIFLLIGSVVPIQEISRSVVYTLPAYSATKSAMISVGTALRDAGNPLFVSAGNSILEQSQYGRTWSDSIKTLDKNGASSENFIGPVQDNIFCEFFARQ